MMSAVKVAVVQAEPAFFDLEGCLEKVAYWSDQAAKEQVDLILFPESFIPCYPRGLGFGTVVGSRSSSGRDEWLQYWNNSIEIPGSASRRLGQIAKAARAWLIIGVTERDAIEGSLYCSLLYYNPNGQLVHKHRKLKPTAAERIIWGEGKGDSLKVLDSKLGKIGGLICWENYMPLARLTLYEQGIQLYMAPTADERDTWQATMVHIACEGRCFVLGCNQFVRTESYPDHLKAQIAPEKMTMSRGGSVIISPLGHLIAGPLFDQEGILYAQLDLTEVYKGKMDFSAVGHYGRPDVFDFRWKKSSP